MSIFGGFFDPVVEDPPPPPPPPPPAGKAGFEFEVVVGKTGIPDESGDQWLIDPPTGLGGSGTGAPRIFPDWESPCQLRGTVIATPGIGFREARAVHERRVRVYELPIPLAERAQVEAIRKALEKAGSGGYVRWRHPKDDPPVGDPPTGSPLESTPLWRVVNYAQAWNLSRNQGATDGTLVLVLEEAVPR